MLTQFTKITRTLIHRRGPVGLGPIYLAITPKWIPCGGDGLPVGAHRVLPGHATFILAGSYN
jgi:hypothetical protein